MRTQTTCLFVSDLHLDDETVMANAAFGRFVESALRGYDEIYVLGDLVEVWVGDDDDAPFARRLRTLLRQASRHSDLFLMHGNRDFLFGETLAQDAGARLLEDPTVIERNGRRILLSHGDVYCTRDTAYQRMRRLLRSPAWQADVLARSLAERREMARALRAQSAAASANKHDNIMDVTETEIRSALVAYNADIMVHGHTHRPGVHDHQLGDRSVRRYVLGHWDRCGWALRGGAGGGFELFRFQLRAGAA